nr:arylacetamide deacetylase-like 3 [Pogona vitticeps]
MEFLSILWTLASYASIAILAAILGYDIYYDMKRTHIPPGIPRGKKLRLFNFILNMAFGVAVLLEKLGICHRYKIWRAIFKGIPPKKTSKLIIKDLTFDEVPVRVYWPTTTPVGNRRGLVYTHGGIGIIGTIEAYERLCRYIARRSDSVVVNVGFRLAPEHPYPVPVLDCCTATIHFLKHAKEYGVDPHRIAIGGDSSGGTFATAVCQHLVTRKDLPKLRAQILLYPFLQGVDFSLPSYQQNHSVPVLFQKRLLKHGSVYLTGTYLCTEDILKSAHVSEEMRAKYSEWISAKNIPEEFKARGYTPVGPAPFSKESYEKAKGIFEPMFSPLLAEDGVVHQLPETFILTCEYDVVRDDGLLYKKRLEDHGVPVTWCHVQDGFHGILCLIDYGPLEFPNTRSSMKRIVHFLKGL